MIATIALGERKETRTLASLHVETSDVVTNVTYRYRISLNVPGEIRFENVPAPELQSLDGIEVTVETR